MDEAKRILELRKRVRTSPGSEEFVELAKLLSQKPETRAEGREVCFRGLVESPNNNQARLILARLFYLDGMTEFCIRELVALQNRVSTPSLARLIESFGEVARPFLGVSATRVAIPAAATSATTPREQSAPSVVGSESKSDFSSPDPEDDEDEVFGEMDLDDEFLEVLVDLEDD